MGAVSELASEPCTTAPTPSLRGHAMSDSQVPSVDAVRKALSGVNDPEINKPITDLGMVKDVRVDDDGRVDIEVYLTIAGCPLRDKITRDVTAAVAAVPG